MTFPSGVETSVSGGAIGNESFAAGLRLTSVCCPQCRNSVPVESAHVNADRLWALAGELPALHDLGVIGAVAAVALDRARRGCPGHETIRVDGDDIPEDIAALCAEFADLLADPVRFGAQKPAPSMEVPGGLLEFPSGWTPERVEEFRAEWERLMARGEAHRHRLLHLDGLIRPAEPAMLEIEIKWSEDGEERSGTFGPFLTAPDDSHMATIGGFITGWREGSGIEPSEITLKVADPA